MNPRDPGHPGGSVALARWIRGQVLRMVAKAGASHAGSCLSMADLLAVLYSGILRVDPARPAWPERDRFLLGKGHGAAALYAVLARSGFLSETDLETFGADGSSLTGHASHHVPGVELSTGSLGHGLPVGVGLALAATRGRLPWRTFVLLGDGECDEGSVWEAAMFASHHRLDSLVAIVDRNRLQGFGRTEAVLGLEPLADRWRAFGWAVREVDGHDHSALERFLSRVPFETGRPGVLIAATVKGKGVSFMEDRLEWHYRSPTSEELARALAEVEGGT
jgi:transketolase